MKFPNLLFIILISICTNTIHGQIIKYEFPHYYLDNEKIQKRDIKNYLLQKENSRELLMIRSRKIDISQILGGATLLSAFFTIRGLTQWEPFAGGDATLFLVAGSTTILCGIFTIAMADQASNYFKQAIDAYNDEVSIIPDKTSLEFGMTNSGVGFVYSF